MRIRSYRDADYAALVRLLRANGMHTPLEERSALKRRVARERGSILLAEQRGRIVGCIFLVYDPWLSTVWRLCVDPRLQGGGIGSALLARAEAALARKGSQAVCLLVDEAKPVLIDYYESRGYEHYGTVTPMWKTLEPGTARRARAYRASWERREGAAA